MMGFNLSAWAVRERALTLFLIIAVALAGAYAFVSLGRAEDPAFTIKGLTVTAVWPGATAQEMQDLVADKMEKKLQELRYFDKVETFTRPGYAFVSLNLRDTMPPKEKPTTSNVVPCPIMASIPSATMVAMAKASSPLGGSSDSPRPGRSGTSTR